MYILSICCLSFVDNDQQEQGDIVEPEDCSTDQETCQGISRDAVCTDLCCSSGNINQPTVMALLKKSKRVYGSGANTQTSYFLSKWYKSFPWLHFCSSKSKALCFYCTKVECFNDELESRSSIYVYWIFKLEKGNSLIQRT